MTATQTCSVIVLVFSTFFASAQKIIYSDFEKKELYRFKFDAIVKQNGKILVYKAEYHNSPFTNIYNGYAPQSAAEYNQYWGTLLTANPSSPIVRSTICLYDLNMKLLKQIDLGLPVQIFGVHFLVYNDFFYMFYQYTEKRTVFCMAEKIDMDGNIIGRPIIMDKTTGIREERDQSQLYTVINSENNQRIIAFKLGSYADSGAVLTCILFDKDLHPINHFHGSLANYLSLDFSEFKADNEGNLVFTARSSDMRENDLHNASFLFTLHASTNSVSHRPLPTADYIREYPRLWIDNKSRKYLLASFYGKNKNESIEGINVVVVDAAVDSIISVINTPMKDSIRSLVGKNHKAAFDDFYIDDVLLRNDRGFVIIARQLYAFPAIAFFTRWDYQQHFLEKMDYDFIFYDPYAFDHYFPWKIWRYFRNQHVGYGSSRTLYLSFGADGFAEWANVMNTEQSGSSYLTIGSKNVIVNSNIYLLFNKIIKGREYFVAQTINAVGEISADGQSRDDIELANTNDDYTFFPMFGRQLSANEIIVPCRKSGKLCLAKIEF